ncbi:MAG: hypothetical protein JSV44_01585 [Candidatus Zixiibacteriota bacterium]|nr:MAG: hypothetical protein JSV44_01585 [candidate division Zixibacteria bacterium]
MPESESKRTLPPDDDDWLGQTRCLAEQVKLLALNLAINLARSKNQIRELAALEPQFTRLINGSVELIREINAILGALTNEKALVSPIPSSPDKLDRIETALNEILTLSGKVHDAIAEIKKKRGKVDNYQ